MGVSLRHPWPGPVALGLSPSLLPAQSAVPCTDPPPYTHTPNPVPAPVLFPALSLLPASSRAPSPATGVRRQLVFGPRAFVERGDGAAGPVWPPRADPDVGAHGAGWGANDPKHLWTEGGGRALPPRARGVLRSFGHQHDWGGAHPVSQEPGKQTVVSRLSGGPGRGGGCRTHVPASRPSPASHPKGTQ